MTFVMGCFTAVCVLFVFIIFLEIVFGVIKRVCFDTLIGYVLGTVCLFALFALFFALAVGAHL